MIDPIKEKAMDVSAMSWAMSLHGENLDHEHKLAVKSISMEETCKGSDSITVTIEDPDMYYIESDLYLTDTPVSFDFWFQGTSEKYSFYGYISTIDIEFSEEGTPTVELYCLDKTHLMQRVKNTQTWNKVRSIDVVKEKVEGYGFKLVYEEDYEYLTEDSISQSHQTDIEFLEGLADGERELFVAKLIGDTFFYIRLGLLAEPKAQLFYRYDAVSNNVKSFRPRIDKEERKVEVQYADIETRTKDIDSFFANQVSVALQTQGYPVEVSSVTYGSEPYIESKKNSGSSDSNSAEREYRDIEYNTLRGDADLVPTPELVALRIMDTINFFGLGTYLSGLYFIEGIKRTLDTSTGYSQTLTLIKTGFGETVKPASTERFDEVTELETVEGFAIGDKVRFKEGATYAHAHEGVSVPYGIIMHGSSFTISELDASGRCVLLKELNSWTHMDDVEKA